MFRSRPMALAMGQYFASNFTFFICLTWMYPYLKDHYGLSAAEASGYTMVPLLFGATAQWAAGFLVDLIYRSGLRHWSRRLPAILGFALSAAALIGVIQADTPLTAVVFFTIATFGVEMTISPSWYTATGTASTYFACAAGLNLLAAALWFFMRSLPSER